MKKILILILLCATTALAHDKFPLEKLDRKVKDLAVMESAWVYDWQMIVDTELYCWLDFEARIQTFLPEKTKENMILVSRLKKTKWQIDITYLMNKKTIYEGDIPNTYYKIDKIIWRK